MQKVACIDCQRFVPGDRRDVSFYKPNGKQVVLRGFNLTGTCRIDVGHPVMAEIPCRICKDFLAHDAEESKPQQSLF